MDTTRDDPLELPLRDKILRLTDKVFGRLEQQIASPRRVRFREGFLFRYKEQSIKQALGLHAADCLLVAGFLQEQGALLRMLDEINEDVLFLATASEPAGLTALHQRYLAAFNEDQSSEMIDPSRPVKGPDSPKRKQIRKYTREVPGAGGPDSFADAAVAKAYSGYVHAASQNVMEMYDGTPPRFQVLGQAGTSLQMDHARDMWNYLYRSYGSFIVAAKVFGDQSSLDLLMRHLPSLDERMATL